MSSTHGCLLFSQCSRGCVHYGGTWLLWLQQMTVVLIIYSTWRFCPTLCVNSEEDLPVKPQKEWVHMDKLEPEKLEWMRDLPAPRKKGTKKVRRDLYWNICTLCPIYLHTYSYSSSATLHPDRPCRLVLILLVIWFHLLKTCPPTWVCTTTGRSLRSVGNKLKIKKVSFYYSFFSVWISNKCHYGDSWYSSFNYLIALNITLDFHSTLLSRIVKRVLIFFLLAVIWFLTLRFLPSGQVTLCRSSSSCLGVRSSSRGVWLSAL